MDKLAPIIKQKFWILLGIGIIMTFTGWWMATGTLAATVKTRVEEVNAAFGKVPSGEIPNNDWSTKLAARNTEQDRAVRNTASLLWERQVSRMTWPKNITPFTRDVAYRGEIPLAARENYRLDYSVSVKDVWESVRPYNQLEGTGIVVFGTGPQALQQKKWGALAPSSADMWDAQEDLWLMQSLLQSIVDVNNGRDAQRNDASIHAIEKLELFGGVPAAQRKTAPSASAASPGGSMGAPGGGHGMMGGSPGPGSFGGGASGPGADGVAGGRAGAPALASADFDRREEFGDDGSAKAGGAGGMGGMGMGGPGGGPAGSHGMGGSSPSPGGASTATAANTIRRYIEDDAASPFKTRGFYMTLIMDHRKIPSLIAELSANEKSAWPVEVVRIQMVRLHDDDIGSGIGGGGGPGMTYPGGSGSGRGFSLSNILSASGGAGGLGMGGLGSQSYDNDMAAGAPSSLAASGPGYGQPGMTGTNVAISPAAAGLAALENALQDPFMARVAICGYITLYKEVKPEPVATTPGAPAAAPAGTPPAAGPGATTADPAADPAATTPESMTEEAPAEGETPAESNPSKPADPAAATPPEAAGNAPAAPATPETTPDTLKAP